MIDFAGSGVVHVTGGFTALIATMLLGPRKGRFYSDRGVKLERPKVISGHSKSLQVRKTICLRLSHMTDPFSNSSIIPCQYIPQILTNYYSLQMLGSFILWFGWYGFNAGSAIEVDAPLRPIVIARAVVNTTLSGACSGIVALLLNLFLSVMQTGDPTYKISSAMNGCLAGLAAITGSCGIIEPWSAIVIGIVSGILYLYACHLLDKFCIDDAVDAIPVHLVGGSWGVIATGLFASPRGLRQFYGHMPEHVGLFYSWGQGSSDFALIACQIAGLLFIIGWILSIMTPFFFVLNYMGIFRSEALEEIVGLDVSYHGYSIARLDEEVTEADLDEYYRRNRRYQRAAADEHEDEVDVANVDQFE